MTSLLFVFALNTLNTIATAQEIVESHETFNVYSPKNFKDNKRKAEDWREESRKKMKKESNLSEDEKKIMDTLTDTRESIDITEKILESDVNTMLSKTKGDLKRLESMPKLGDRLSQLTESVEKLDSAIEKGFELVEPQVVHKSITVSSLGNDDFSRDVGTGEIDKKVMNIFKNLTELPYLGEMHQFGVYNLNSHNEENNNLVDLELTVPSGTKIVFREDGKVILPREKGLKIIEGTSPTIINKNGKEYIKIEAELVELDEVNAGINKVALDTTEKINAILENQGELSPPFSFDFSGELGALAISNANKALIDTFTEMPPKLMRNIIKFMKEKQGEIIFTNSPIPLSKKYSPDSTELKNDFSTNGKTNSEHRTITIKVDEFGEETENLKREIGFVLDDFLAAHKGPLSGSKSEEFQSNFENEKQYLPTPFGKQSPRDFWAEVTRMIHAPDAEYYDLLEEKMLGAYDEVTRGIIFIEDFEA